jgi:type IV secretion system protein VirB2
LIRVRTPFHAFTAIDGFRCIPRELLGGRDAVSWFYRSPKQVETGATMNWGLSARVRTAITLATPIVTLALPGLAFAQASPFLTGATALQTNILAWLTPVAIILVMVLGAMAMANRISWAWCIAAILGIAIAFGASQIVTWVRGLFGV